MANVKNDGNKKFLVLLIILVAWFVFSVIYVGYDLWSDFKNYQLNQTYQQAQTDTVNQLIKRSKQCQPFTVSSSNDSAKLIGVSCLQQQQNQNPQRPQQ